MIVKLHEQDKFKVAIAMDPPVSVSKPATYSVIVIDGDRSQIIKNAMDDETALEVFNYIIDTQAQNVIESLKVEVKE